MNPGDTVLINSGRYMLNHAVIEQLHPDHGPRGFAPVRFIGLSGTPLKRRGWSKAPPFELPPLDMVPIPSLNAWEPA